MATSPPWLENEGDLKSMCCCCTSSRYLGEVILTRENYALHTLLVAASYTLVCPGCRPHVGGILSSQFICALWCTLKSASRTKQQHMGFCSRPRAFAIPRAAALASMLMLTLQREDFAKLHYWHWLYSPRIVCSSGNASVHKHSGTCTYIYFAFSLHG